MNPRSWFVPSRRARDAKAARALCHESATAAATAAIERDCALSGGGIGLGGMRGGEAEALFELTAPFVDSSNDAADGALCAARAARACRSSVGRARGRARFVDAPGLHDDNAARVRCLATPRTPTVMLVANIRRAVNDKTTKDALPVALRTQLGERGRLGDIAVVATQADVLNASEITANLGPPPPTAAARSRSPPRPPRATRTRKRPSPRTFGRGVPARSQPVNHAGGDCDFVLPVFTVSAVRGEPRACASATVRRAFLRREIPALRGLLRAAAAKHHARRAAARAARRAARRRRRRRSSDAHRRGVASQEDGRDVRPRGGERRGTTQTAPAAAAAGEGRGDRRGRATDARAAANWSPCGARRFRRRRPRRRSGGPARSPRAALLRGERAQPAPFRLRSAPAPAPARRAMSPGRGRQQRRRGYRRLDVARFASRAAPFPEPGGQRRSRASASRPSIPPPFR